MKQLIQIKTIPFSFEFKINNAKLEPVKRNTNPSYVMERQKGGLSINSRPAKLKLDTFETRASLGLKSVSRSVEEYANLGKQYASEATINFVEEGNMMLDTHNNSDSICQIAFNRSMTTLESNIAFLPSVPVQINWEPHSLSMQYNMDKLKFDWRISHPKYEYIPYNIEIKVKEYARTEIEYIGDPVYVPPSSNPDYKPNPLDKTA